MWRVDAVHHEDPMFPYRVRPEGDAQGAIAAFAHLDDAEDYVSILNEEVEE